MLETLLPILAIVAFLGLLDLAAFVGGVDSREGFQDPRQPDHWASIG